MASGAVLALVSPPVGLDWLHWFAFLPALLALSPVDPPRPARTRGRTIRVVHAAALYLLLASIFSVVGNVHPLVVAAAVVAVSVLLATDPMDRSRNFRLGWLLGITATFCLFFWLLDTITTFSNIPLPAALVVLLIFSLAFSLPYGLLFTLVHPVRRRFGDAWIVLFPLVWVASEWIAPAPFPYFQGVGQYRNPWTWQSASVFGATFLSWLVLATNCAFASVLYARREGRPPPWAWIGAVALVWVGNLGFGIWRHAAVESALAGAPTLRVSLIQQGITMVERLQDRGSDVLKGWIELTRKVEADDPDLVVWPEGSIAYNPNDPKVAAVLGRLAREGGYHLLVGGGTSEADPASPRRRTHWNSAWYFGNDGTIQGRYDKMVPLPFGEYLPPPFHVLDGMIEGVGHFRPGTSPTVFTVGDTRFSTPICYEAILEHQMRTLGDVDVFVNITNDGWFGVTSAPWQHGMLSAVHAMELGRPMVRIAYTGISMVIEPHGDIVAEHPPATEAAEVIALRLGRFETPYRTWGRAFPWLAMTAGLVVLAFALRGPVTSELPERR